MIAYIQINIFKCYWLNGNALAGRVKGRFDLGAWDEIYMICYLCLAQLISQNTKTLTFKGT